MLKNFLIAVQPVGCQGKQSGGEKTQRKTLAITLLLITACAAFVGGLLMTAHADDSNSTAATTSYSTTTQTAINATNPPPMGMNDMNIGDQGFGGNMGNRFMNGPPGMGDNSIGMNNIEISSAYTANVTAVLDSDTNIQNLLSEGYNVTSIHPIIQSTINGDGTITQQATNAIVTLQNGTSGFATAHVDLETSKVTQIVIITRTVIDNSTTSNTTTSSSTASS